MRNFIYPSPSIDLRTFLDLWIFFLLSVAWIFSIASPQHFFPVSSYYQEVALATAVLLATLIGAVSRRGTREHEGVALPWAALPFFGIALLGLLGLALRRAAYPDFLIWPVGTVLIAAIAAVLAAQWAARGQAQALMTAWAWAFALGALGTALSMWAQLFMPNTIALWLFPRTPLQAPMGNIAQRNQAALVLGFGLLALAYFARAGVPARRWRLALLALGAVLFVSGVALSQSRIGLAFIAVAGVLGGMLLAPAARRGWGALLGLLAVAALYALLQWVIYTGFGLSQLFPPGLQRLADRGLGQRLGLWHIAWEAFKAHPLLGVGLGNFVQWDYRLALTQPQPLFANNAHNLFAQLAAETGVAGLLVAVVPAAISVAKAWRRWVRPQAPNWEGWRLLALGVCLMVLGYSLTEYPLWYVFYAVPFAMSWAVLDTPAMVFRVSRELRWLWSGVLLAALAFCGWAARAYVDIARASAEVFLSAPASGEQARAVAEAVQQTLRSPGFSPYADALVFVQMSADRFMLPDKIALGERVVTTYSSPQLIAKLGTLYGLAGEPEKAARSFARLCAYFPDDCGHAGDNVRALQKENPKDFDAVARLFFAMPQSRIQSVNVNVLRPWDKHSQGTVVTIDPAKTWFGFDLALYASGLAQQGYTSGSFLAQPGGAGARR